MKQRKAKCRICRAEFEKRSMSHVCCSPEHALEFAKRLREKKQKAEQQAERKADKAKREKMKRRGDWMREAKQAFNAFIRARDEGKPCICCGRFEAPGYSRGGMWDAGHYRSTGSAPHLRFEESNCHRQLKQCNSYGAGRAVDYRIGLVRRIGAEAVEAIEADNEPRKWSIDELKAIKARYKQLTNEMKGRAEA